MNAKVLSRSTGNDQAFKILIVTTSKDETAHRVKSSAGSSQTDVVTMFWKVSSKSSRHLVGRPAPGQLRLSASTPLQAVAPDTGGAVGSWDRPALACS